MISLIHYILNYCISLYSLVRFLHNFSDLVDYFVDMLHLFNVAVKILQATQLCVAWFRQRESWPLHSKQE